ncbi:MAG: zinc ribbon domain-containing protein [Anaerolinea sp.]|nr:zinc ribbon domain-containing protein [Anaerolinea sp.]
MPLYEYDCPSCGREFEKRMSMAEADKAICPHCGNEYTTRRLSRIMVKGQSNGGSVSSAPAIVSGGG